MKEIIDHYECLIDEDNDAVRDVQILRDYMDKWDGKGFLDELKLDKSKTVLEIGIGTGRLAIKVIPNCKHFTGIDFSAKTIKRANENLAELENKTLICSDFLEYSFESKFDIIYSSLTFLHIKEKQKAINIIANLLEEEGRFVLSVSKDQSNELDFGTRKVPLYPDNPQDIKTYLTNAELKLLKEIETEFAWIIVTTTLYR